MRGKVGKDWLAVADVGDVAYFRNHQNLFGEVLGPYRFTDVQRPDGSPENADRHREGKRDRPRQGNRAENAMTRPR